MLYMSPWPEFRLLSLRVRQRSERWWTKSFSSSKISAWAVIVHVIDALRMKRAHACHVIRRTGIPQQHWCTKNGSLYMPRTCPSYIALLHVVHRPAFGFPHGPLPPPLVQGRNFYCNMCANSHLGLILKNILKKNVRCIRYGRVKFHT